jgi:hypothetical protein
MAVSWIPAFPEMTIRGVNLLRHARLGGALEAGLAIVREAEEQAADVREFRLHPDQAGRQG